RALSLPLPAAPNSRAFGDRSVPHGNPVRTPRPRGRDDPPPVLLHLRRVARGARRFGRPPAILAALVPPSIRRPGRVFPRDLGPLHRDGQLPRLHRSRTVPRTHPRSPDLP